MPKKTQTCKVCQKSKAVTEFVRLSTGGYRKTCTPCVTTKIQKVRKQGLTKKGKRRGRPPGPSNKKKVTDANRLLVSDEKFGKLFPSALLKRLRAKAISRVVITLDTPDTKIAIFRTEVTTLEVQHDA